ncbi:MAG TPA: hypothetical protein VGO91_01685 [Pyrinomonadaceae bacterium]|nr:hypothetical protein [Pyrinomonadaceae bacterium]
MIKIANKTQATSRARGLAGAGERGAALLTALLILALLGVIAMSVLSTVTTETRVAGSDLCRTQTFYAATADIEKMTSDFSSLFARTSRPTSDQLYGVQQAVPPELTGEGFDILPDLKKDQATLDTLGLGPNPVVTVPTGPFAGLIATVTPYILTATATNKYCGGQVKVQREMNNYLIPLFQFGMFSNEDIELHPGPAFSFNGRIHANGNIYVNGNVTFLNKVTTANELVTDVLRNGSVRAGATVSMVVGTQTGTINVPITAGSVVNGPNFTGASKGQRGYSPGSPNGTPNSTWSQSTAPPKVGTANQFGGQLQTRTTGGAPLLLPLELDGNPTREIIKRRMPNDNQTLSESRYHSKAEIRILIDDEGVNNDAAGLNASQNGVDLKPACIAPCNGGVNLSLFTPSPLPAGAPSGAANGAGRALWRIADNGQYIDTVATAVQQRTKTGGVYGSYADTVRGVQGLLDPLKTSSNGAPIPAGAGLKGHILIQIVDSLGVARDVTQQILSMGVTEGEPNSIIQLQRPLWAAFTQGSRDASGLTNIAPNGTTYTNCLTDILNRTSIGADGEIQTKPGPTQAGIGYLTGILDDNPGTPQRSDAPPSLNINDWGVNTCGGGSNKSCWNENSDWNAIVPINVYNVREGHLNTTLNQNNVYERGMTNVIEINMKNLARWVDGVYDANLLQGTPAVSGNIGSPDGYILYVSDRRGDKIKSERDSSGVFLQTTNGMDDNEDIYGPNGSYDAGEDVIDSGEDSTGLKYHTLQKDTSELPDPAALPGAYGADRNKRALTASAWANLNSAPLNINSHKYFRNSVRLFNAEDLTGGGNRLSITNGITVSSENMVYIWGSYNTTGINLAPPNGQAALNNAASPYRYLGNQVPSSIVCDAFFPLSKTWFDSSSSLYPDTIANRPADNGLAVVTQETSVRAGVIAGNNLSALSGAPDQGNGADSRLSGGLHNFPRFLEDWNTSARRWNFVGSLIPLYHSTQAMGPWWYVNPYSLYYAPIRDWAFDDTFTNPNRLPPGTPSFQHIEPTGFRQVL